MGIYTLRVLRVRVKELTRYKYNDKNVRR